MNVTTEWIGGVAFVGKSGQGQAVLMDGAAEEGGRNLGPRPMEMLLLGMGGCSSYDVVNILRKSRQTLHGCKVEISATRSEQAPKVFTSIHMHFILSGEQLNHRQVARAIELSAEKYCSASIMLGQSADITHDYEVLEEGSPLPHSKQQ